MNRLAKQLGERPKALNEDVSFSLTPQTQLRASQLKANAKHSQILRSLVSCSARLDRVPRDSQRERMVERPRVEGIRPIVGTDPLSILIMLGMVRIIQCCEELLVPVWTAGVFRRRCARSIKQPRSPIRTIDWRHREKTL